MPEIARYLITTADERTWKFDRPVLFLGEWCRLFSRRHIWQGMDFLVAPPYGLGQEAEDRDHVEARALEEKLFPMLCDALNRYHGKKHSSRFWRIMLGHWLRRYVDVIFNRVRTVEQCLKSYQLSGTTVFTGNDCSLATLDSYAAIWAFNDDRWNSVLYMRILSLLGAEDFPVEIISCAGGEDLRGHAKASKLSLGRQLLRNGYQLASKPFGLLAREDDAFIINSGLPRKEEVMLQLALRQAPRIHVSPKLTVTKKPSHELRCSLSDQIADRGNNALFEIICSLVFEALPVCFLEGFAELDEKVQQLPWPDKPKFIFTGNSYDTDEVFKLWAATKVESDAEYLIGQHGNNYGTYRYMYPSIEEITSDRFLTWGWTDGLPQHTPAFLLKAAGREAESYNPSGQLLLIELHAGLMLSTWDATAEFKAYFEDQQRFVEKLQATSREQLTVRLHGAHVNLKWSDEERWKEFDPAISLDNGATDIGKLIAESRLVVHSYDSTGLLETLAQNIPTIAFWKNDLEHLRDNAKPYYQLLVDAGIVHLTPQSAAAKVNEVWGDVEGWWMQASVQDARKKFCNRYARISHSPVRELKKVLLGDIT